MLSQFARITETIKAKNTGSSPEGALVLCELLQPGALLAYYKVRRLLGWGKGGAAAAGAALHACGHTRIAGAHGVPNRTCVCYLCAQVLDGKTELKVRRIRTVRRVFSCSDQHHRRRRDALAVHDVVTPGPHDGSQAELTTVPGAPAGATCYSVTLSAALPAGETISLALTAVAVKAQKAFPVEITQQESQLMVYLDNVYVVSPYAVSAQTTEVRGEGGRGCNGATEVGVHAGKSSKQVITCCCGGCMDASP